MVKDFFHLHWLAKVEQYGAEYEYYKDKYRISLNEFEKSLHQITGKEDFDKENDLEDWEFADHALRYWMQETKEIQLDKNSWQLSWYQKEL